jgi:hypothetical protein
MPHSSQLSGAELNPVQNKASSKTTCKVIKEPKENTLLSVLQQIHWA